MAFLIFHRIARDHCFFVFGKIMENYLGNDRLLAVQIAASAHLCGVICAFVVKNTNRRPCLKNYFQRYQSLSFLSG